MSEIAIRINGMGCGSCVQKVKTALGAIPGVTVDEVAIGRAKIRATGPEAASLAAVAALNRLGFDATVEGRTSNACCH